LAKVLYEIRFSERLRSVRSFAAIDPNRESGLNEDLEKEYEEIASLKELLQRDMKKLRFESSAARKYSLGRQP
jgi:hypothetical protein